MTIKTGSEMSNGRDSGSRNRHNGKSKKKKSPPVTPRTEVINPPEASPRPPASQVFNANDAGSHVSNLTDHSGSAVSRLGSVIAQAKLILQGENPSDPAVLEEDSDEDYDDDMFQPARDKMSLRDEQSVCTNDSIDFLKDNHSEMTHARRLALKLMDKGWYNPRAKKDPNEVAIDEANEEKSTDDIVLLDDKYKDKDGNITFDAIKHAMADSNVKVEAYPFSHSRREVPSLEKAWAYFDHVTLPRYVVEEKHKNKKNVFVRFYRRLFKKGNTQLQRAEPGEDHLPTRLYRPIFTPHSQLGDWGLGIGLYFSTLRAVCVLTFLAGCLNILNIQYFASNNYSGDQEGLSSPLMRGSAICTDRRWVPCPDCNEDDNVLKYAKRVGSATNDTLKFAYRNECDSVTIEQGYVNWATIVLFMLGIFAIDRYLKRMEVSYDEDEQTAQDYSIIVTNPPPDATDPEEWRCFFRDNFDNAHVTVCTVAVENDLLVRSLVERREILRKIEMMIEPGTSLDQLTLAGLAVQVERERRVLGHFMARFFSGLPEHFARLAVLTAKVQGLAQQDYPVTNVFITFEKESDQRNVLKHLTTGSIPAARGHTSNIKPNHLFRGNKILLVDEPDEPSTIRWQDLNEGWKARFRQQALTTTATVVAILLVGFIVFITNDASLAFSAYAIAFFNLIFPMFAKYLTGLEAHSSEGGKQRSLYFKIALFRWVNTAVVITIITPHTDTLSRGGLISQVYALFSAEITTTNGLQLLDPFGHISRHFSAPRAKTQDAMNLCMRGSNYELAERYTNLTKLLFLAVWYCSIYPGALFLCSFAIFVNYFVDRFSLMRSWERAPALGPETSQFSRRYFFPLAVCAMALVSSYYWSGFPFDNICATDQSVPVEMLGSWKLDDSDMPPIVVTSSETAYQYCLQDFLRYNISEEPFPFLPQFQRKGREWMTEDQEHITTLFAWTTVALLAILALFVISMVGTTVYSWFYKKYIPRGDDQGINFSDVPSISTYVPQVESTVFSYPLVACNVDQVDEELFDWQDPDRPMSFYDLTKDAQVLLRGIDKGKKKVRFSNVTHWPPAAKMKKSSKSLAM